MSISEWSTTPANNNAAPPTGAPEGMAAASVNNTMREMMADIKAGTLVFSATKAIMTALDIDKSSEGDQVLMGGVATNGDQGGGVFTITKTNISAEVTIDTQGGIHIPFDSDATGAAGGFIRQFSGAFNVKWFGAKGDGSTDDTAAFQGVADTQTGGGDIFVPISSSFYKLTTVTISNDNTRFIIEKDAHLKWPVLGVDTFGFSVEANGFEYDGGKMEGPASGVHVSAENGFSSIGANTSTRFIGFKVTNVEIFNFGGRGIELKFVDEITIEYNLIHNCGNAGALFKSCNTGSFFKNIVHTITPGESGNMWGMSLTHTSTNFNVDQTTNPFCRRWDVSANEVYNIPVWTGLDAHGLWDSTITNNRVFACKQGIEMGVSSGDAANFAGGNLTIADNIVNASNRDGTTSGAEHLSRGISCRGGTSSKNDNVILSNNNITGYGVKDDLTNSSIYALFCDGIQIIGNIIRSWQGTSIRIDNSSGIATSNMTHGMASADIIGRIFRWDGGTEKFRFIGNGHDPDDTGIPANIGVFVDSAVHERMFASGNDFADVATSKVFPVTGVNALWKGTDFGNIMKSNDSTIINVVELSGANGVVIFDNTAPKTITDFTNSVQGQELTLINSNSQVTTISRVSGMQLDGAANQVLQQNYTIRLTRNEGVWFQSSKLSANS